MQIFVPSPSTMISHHGGDVQFSGAEGNCEVGRGWEDRKSLVGEIIWYGRNGLNRGKNDLISSMLFCLSLLIHLPHFQFVCYFESRPWGSLRYPPSFTPHVYTEACTIPHHQERTKMEVGKHCTQWSPRLKILYPWHGACDRKGEKWQQYSYFFYYKERMEKYAKGSIGVGFYFMTNNPARLRANKIVWH